MAWKKTVRQYGKLIRKDKSIRLLKLKYTGKRANSQCEWYAIRNPIKMLWTALVFQILRKTPPSNLKNSVYRMFGMKIGKDVAIAYNVLPDPLYPELIEIEEGVLLGSDIELGCHEFINHRFTLGRIKIKKNSMIGAYAMIGAGITIGENAVIGLRSFVREDVPDNEFWAGSPAKLIKKIDPKDLVPKKAVEILKY